MVRSFSLCIALARWVSTVFTLMLSFCGDFLVDPAFGDLLDDLAFAVGQAACARLRFALQEFVEEHLRYRAGEIGAVDRQAHRAPRSNAAPYLTSGRTRGHRPATPP